MAPFLAHLVGACFRNERTDDLDRHAQTTQDTSAAQSALPARERGECAVKRYRYKHEGLIPLMESDDGEWVRYEDANIAIADALDKHQHLMDHYMLLKARVAEMEQTGLAAAEAFNANYMAAYNRLLESWKNLASRYE